MQTYHLPLLPRMECLTTDSKFNLDKGILLYGKLDLEKVGTNDVSEQCGSMLGPNYDSYLL